MNKTEAIQQMEPDSMYKFVGILVPPLLYLTRAYDGGPTHVEMADEKHLVVCESREGLWDFYPVNPNLFRAGTVMCTNDSIILGRKSVKFPEYMATPDELERMLTNTFFV